MTLRKNSSTTAHPINPEPKRNILHLRIPFVLFLTTLFLSLPSAQAQLKINSHTLKLNNVFSIISNLYVDSINENKLVEAAILGALKELDPHSSYIPKEEVERVNEPLEGSFEGVGIQFQIFEDTILVVQTISGTPAEKVGVMPGDRIVYINNDLVAGVKFQNSDVVKRLRGPRGSVVEVKIHRRGVKELMLFKITRDKIPINSIDASYMIDKETGYIRINNFGSKTVQEYKEAFVKLRGQGMQNLILSLQGNGGGYMNAAIDLADEFLSAGQLVVYTEGARQPKNVANATSRGDFESGKLIILVDEYSASASEIVSGAVQDWDRGIIIGRRSFGKGLVQRQIPLTDGSMLRLTTSRYHTPTGRSIQKPYKDGVEKYQKDLEERFKHGEMLTADSIQFPDSLKYKTLRLQRTVYGGGGIMPDIFVPIDTTKFTPYHRKIISQGIMNKVSVQYIEKNRADLKKCFTDFESFQKRFKVGDELMDQLTGAATAEKIELNEAQYAISKPLIQLQLKALIARDLWSVNEYYRIMDQENESLQAAIKLLNTPGQYERMLRKPD
ncbi:MAG: S41 family peptidase [Paludibacter sp.]|jgi:carboxyl-terminal processing protease|nr:S41 family peptidase [Paludibacter sp.]